MSSSFRLGRLFGIPIHIHYTWFIIFALVTITLGASYFPNFYPRWPSWLHWLIAVATSLLFFTSVVAHELSHSLVSRYYGVPVRSITLFIFGGVAHIGREAAGPMRELAMAIAGPLSSLAVAVVFGLVNWVVSPYNEPVAALAWWLMRINVLLAIFNLIPGFPLDGGRVFRALWWRLSGDFLKATRAAVVVGRGIGYLFMAGGLGIVLFMGDWLGGLWFAFIGWFLENVASASYQQARLKEALRGVSAGELMSQECVIVPPGITVEELVRDYVLPRGSRCAVVARGGRLAGMLTMANLRGLPRGQWPFTPVEAAAIPLAHLQVAQPGDDALEVLERMEEEDIGQVVVLRGEEVLGVLFREHVLRYARTRMDLGYAGGS
ncbi:MAG: site-2 protease family protein [Dehalococcoidia bacterium]